MHIVFFSLTHHSSRLSLKILQNFNLAALQVLPTYRLDHVNELDVFDLVEYKPQ